MQLSRSVQVGVLFSFILLFSVLSIHSDGGLNATVPETLQLHLTGAEDHSITLADAVTLTANYRKSPLRGDALAESFGRDAIAAILAHPKCVGLKIYYGMRDDGRQVMVLIGVDGEGSDLTDGYIAETGVLCPPICGNSVLLGQAF
jgi:hypothetical protein